jgi:hypothetical protein
MMHLVFYGVILPILLASVAGGIIWRAWDRHATPFGGGAWALPLLLGIAWSVGANGIFSGMRFPPVSANERLIMAGAGLSLGALLLLIRRDRVWVTAPMALVLGGLAVGYVLLTRLSIFGSVMFASIALGAGFLVAIASLSTDQLSSHASRWLGPLGFTLLATLVSGAIGISGSVKFAHLAGILAAFHGPLIVLSLMKRTFHPGLPVLLVAYSALAGLVAAGHQFAELPARSLVLLAAAAVVPPALAAVSCHRSVSNPWVLALIHVGGIAFLAGLGVVHAIKSSPPLDPYDYY